MIHRKPSYTSMCRSIELLGWLNGRSRVIACHSRDISWLPWSEKCWVYQVLGKWFRPGGGMW